ncbi:MAG: hypothetical protein K2J48_07955 [Muribaculaceae bacterium]|nr:hypothetical protein [Muribaculaceae bacterium]
MAIDDVDFSGDDWYGNDYSQSISDILEILGNLFGLLIIRDRLTVSDLDQLRDMILNTNFDAVALPGEYNILSN